MIRIVTALAAVAALAACTPSAKTDAAPALTGLAGAQEKALQAHALLAGCDADPVSEPALYTMPDGAAIFVAPCQMAAYQATSRVFRLNEDGTAELLSFVDYDAGLWRADIIAITAEIDAATGVLTTFAKAAGHGGCGSQARFRWTGMDFELEEMRSRGCSEPMPEGDDAEVPEFPVVYTSPAAPPTTP